MGRPQVDSPAVYPPTRSPPPPPPPQSDPQPQPFPYATEHDDPTAYPPEEISPAAYESYQDTENPQAYSEAPSSYPPPQNDSTNPQQFPSQNPPNNMAYPPQAATYPPNNPPQAATYPPNTPPQAATYPPNNPPPAFPKPMGYGPQPVNFPPRDPPPPPSPHKPFQQNVAAQGIPVQQQFAPVPVQRYGPNMGTVAWTTGLFDCMDDPQNALITAFFPCLTFGQVAEIVDSGHTTCGTSGLMYGCIACLIALPCLLSCTYRTKLRSKYDLVEAPAPDWATHFLCEWCALCQEYRELRNRGLDPELGWHGNMMKNQNQHLQVAMMPPMNQSMMG